MKYLSVCSGIEAATVAWHHMGWSPVGFAEIEKFPAQLLAHHYPGTPNFGDLTKHESWNIESGTVDLLVGGTPCQAFSVAGLRRGMDDERGQLTLEFVRLAARLRPRWIVWENVPGVLSSAGGRDFGSFLGALGELGYGWAYRILDAQYFGVAQRRRRVFVIGYLGDWRRAAAVLFERESVRWDSPPRREAGKATSGGAGAGAAVGFQSSQSGVRLVDTHATLDANNGPRRHNGVLTRGSARQEVAGSIGSRASSGGGFSTDFECSGELKVVGALDCRIGAQRVQNAMGGHLLAQPIAKCVTRGEGYRYDFETTTLLPMATFAKTPMQVRRLTPVECERLQGFPDGYTDIRPRGKDTPDGPRYKAIGNSMAVPVMRWIGERIEAVDKLSR